MSMAAPAPSFLFSPWSLKILNCLKLPEENYEEIYSVEEVVSAVKHNKVP